MVSRRGTPESRAERAGISRRETRSLFLIGLAQRTQGSHAQKRSALSQSAPKSRRNAGPTRSSSSRNNETGPGWPAFLGALGGLRVRSLNRGAISARDP
jgi:hypothetical protein